jgi:hypothetical protein
MKKEFAVLAIVFTVLWRHKKYIKKLETPRKPPRPCNSKRYIVIRKNDSFSLFDYRTKTKRRPRDKSYGGPEGDRSNLKMAESKNFWGIVKQP